ncbi:hypothetical protein G3480_27275 [Thiorhodococcus mannitoliphagus]|uniref:Uncharacterized protein n=1 Tax=Thiorhodococcus mannitoliphagus TaxID=329406 RepID=A0A6P1E7D8_9GAMM|nr:hypothetical protein [Thiorhodococcus mannitoliphagus]NEX23904.1 hypothetical protein [Thiorhodococcus mannitoliphagus]
MEHASEYHATEIGIESENDVLVAAIALEPEGYMMFQRGASEATGRSNGCYFEFSDQSQGNYDIVRKCSLKERKLRISLDMPLNGITEISVSLANVENSVSALKNQLTRVFEGTKGVFRH